MCRGCGEGMPCVKSGIPQRPFEENIFIFLSFFLIHFVASRTSMRFAEKRAHNNNFAFFHLNELEHQQKHIYILNKPTPY